MLKYFEGRTDFELKMFQFFESINFVIDVNYFLSSHIFYFYDDDMLFFIEYDLDSDNKTNIYTIQNKTKLIIKTNDFDDMINHLLRIKVINKALRDKKIKRLLFFR